MNIFTFFATAILLAGASATASAQSLEIRKRQADFDRVLFDFGVPLLDDDDRLIAAPRNAAK